MRLLLLLVFVGGCGLIVKDTHDNLERIRQRQISHYCSDKSCFTEEERASQRQAARERQVREAEQDMAMRAERVREADISWSCRDAKNDLLRFKGWLKKPTRGASWDGKGTSDMEVMYDMKQKVTEECKKD